MKAVVKTSQHIEKAERIEKLFGRAEQLHNQAKADNTHAAYATDVSQYEDFCESVGATPWPATPANMAAWIADMSERLKYSTIQRKVYAVSSVNNERHDVDCINKSIHNLLAGLRREKGKKKETTRKAKAMTGDVTGQMLRFLTNEDARHKAEATDRREIRNRALILLGFAGAFRVSELLRLDISDVAFDQGGMVVTLTSSKTTKGKDAKAETIGVSRWVDSQKAGMGTVCPVSALQNWIRELAGAGITSGRIFRAINPAGEIKTAANKSGDFMTRKSVSDLLKDAAARAGFDGAKFSTHSMRRGHITQAYRNRIPEQDIARTSRHKTIAVLRSYEEEANVYQGSAGQIRV